MPRGSIGTAAHRPCVNVSLKVSDARSEDRRRRRRGCRYAGRAAARRPARRPAIASARSAASTPPGPGRERRRRGRRVSAITIATACPQNRTSVPASAGQAVGAKPWPSDRGARGCASRSAAVSDGGHARQRAGRRRVDRLDDRGVGVRAADERDGQHARAGRCRRGSDRARGAAADPRAAGPARPCNGSARGSSALHARQHLAGDQLELLEPPVERVEDDLVDAAVEGRDPRADPRRPLPPRCRAGSRSSSSRGPCRSRP